MALYVARGTRRRRAIAIGSAALVVGLALGFAGGRCTAPTGEEQVRTVQADARRIAAGLRVLALHGEEDALATQGEGDGGAALVLDTAAVDLRSAIAAAPWITRAEGRRLEQEVDALRRADDPTSEAFAARAEAVAASIEEAFGTGG